MFFQCSSSSSMDTQDSHDIICMKLTFRLYPFVDYSSLMVKYQDFSYWIILQAYKIEYDLVMYGLKEVHFRTKQVKYEISEKIVSTFQFEVPMRSSLACNWSHLIWLLYFEDFILIQKYNSDKSFETISFIF